MIADYGGLSKIACNPHDALRAALGQRLAAELDAAAIYAFIRDRCPALYLEIGSGMSTRFAARAKAGRGL